MPSKSDTHRRSGLYETQNNTTVGNNCAQDRERYGILRQTTKHQTFTHMKHQSQTPELLHTLFFRKKTMYVFTVYLLCVCVGPWAARMAATQRSRIQRLRSKPTSTSTPTPPPARRSSTMSLTMRRPCPPSAPAKPCTHLKVTTTINVLNKNQTPSSWRLTQLFLLLLDIKYMCLFAVGCSW